MAKKTVKTTKAVAKTSLELAREQIANTRVVTTGLKDLINNITKEIHLDKDNMAKRIDSAMRSEYGAINGLINLLVAIGNWPAERGDGASVATNRVILEQKFKLDLMLLAEIAEYRGFHTFVSSELSIIEGREPQYVAYRDYTTVLLEELLGDSAKKINKPELLPQRWQLAEAKAITTAETELTQKLQDLENYNQFIQAQMSK